MLSLVHVVKLVLPLLIIPILARRIAGDDFGIYMYAIGFASWLSILVEYGFNISSTREIASASDSEGVARIVRGTQAAKFLLTLATTPILLIAIYWVPVFSGHAYWAAAAWLLGVVMAMSPVYYFQGKEQLQVVGVVEVLSGIFTLGCVYFFVRHGDDFYRLPLIILLARAGAALYLVWRMCVRAKLSARLFYAFDFGLGATLLKSGFNIFVLQAAVSFYTSFNVVFLGFFCTPIQVGAYAAAERLMRAGLGFLGQFSNAIFPRLNAMKAARPAQMEALRLKVLIGFCGIGVAGMGATYVLGPTVVHYMFGTRFSNVNGIMAVLALLVPAIAISNVLGFQYLLVDRREKLFNAVIGGAAVLNLGISFILVVRYEAMGMAISWVVIEWIISIVLAIIVLILKRKKISITTD